MKVKGTLLGKRRRRERGADRQMRSEAESTAPLPHSPALRAQGQRKRPGQGIFQEGEKINLLS